MQSGGQTNDRAQVHEPLIGRSIERLEDASLLTGQGRFADDLPVARRTAHAAIVRSMHAHAVLQGIDAQKALALDGVFAVLTGHDVKRWSKPFIVGVKADMQLYSLATDRVRYVGEPVAVIVARDRYIAEDALALVEVSYEPLEAIVDPEAAAQPDAPILHPGIAGNVISERTFRYGDPETAFRDAAHVVSLKVSYPRNLCTPLEGAIVVADYNVADDAYEVMANFQGPFSLHPVMALALQRPVNRLRLRTPPDSGGSFGVKQSLVPAIVLMSLAARKAGRPVKWVEDRLEHLAAATSATNRVTEIEGAVTADGELLGLRYRQLEDCGAYLRAPEPATLYRMHGNMTGAYKVQNVAIENRVVLTNKTPTGLNRGFGGPQVYFALERLMHRIADVVGRDHLDVIRANLVPAAAMPYAAPTGGVLDSGDYRHAVDRAIAEGGLAELRTRRDQARAEGRLYGIGLAAVVEPSISNMGYITAVLTPEERAKAGPKDGAAATASVSVDALGSVSVVIDSVPQGQGHRTVIAQVVGDVFGLAPEEIAVSVTLDTAKDGWSIAAGNYSSRFAGAVAGAAHLGASRIRERLARLAAPLLKIETEQMDFRDGSIAERGALENAVLFRRVAGLAHWSPSVLPQGDDPALRETVFWSAPELTAPDANDRVNSSATHGFIFDFCGVEIERDTGEVRIDRYVTMHDAGRLLNPALVDGQVRGAFAHAVGAALYEELNYSPDGSFLAGTFADYLVPTRAEIPEPVILHMQSPSPVTPLGAKGVGEGNCMSTPVCIANAVADALGAEDVTLPLKPYRVAALLHGAERASDGVDAISQDLVAAKQRGGLVGEGTTTVPIARQALWDLLLDPETLAKVLPGCRELKTVGANSYLADMMIRVGPVRGKFVADVALSDLDEPNALRLSGSAAGALGAARGGGVIRLSDDPDADGIGTVVSYDYDIHLSGTITAVGGRLLDGALRVLIAGFFNRVVALDLGEDAERLSGVRRLRNFLSPKRWRK